MVRYDPNSLCLHPAMQESISYTRRISKFWYGFLWSLPRRGVANFVRGDWES